MSASRRDRVWVGCVTALAAGIALEAARAEGDDYLPFVSFEVLGNEHVLLRWPVEKMPLRVYLTAAPDGLFANSDAIHEAVRRGIVDWTGVVSEGVPRFVFVAAIGDADIPVVWERVPDGDWFAHCAYAIEPLARSFRVRRILVTGRWQGRPAKPSEVYRLVLHELGHALGIGGHSPFAGDIMYPSIYGGAEGLSERDRVTLKKLYASPIGSRISDAQGTPSNW